MAYGRLDVYWPDGKIDSYLLDVPTVTVGRASDNTIVLDTETVSRQHFSITHTSNSTYLIDLESENGVMIDGVPLKSYEAHMLQDVEELQVGFLRVIYHPMDDSITVPIRASTQEEETQRVERANTEFGVAIDQAEFSVWPASSSSAEIAITNRMKEARRFYVNISGMPTEWMRVNRPEVEVAPNETTYVLINVKPPRRPDVKPMSYNVVVEVTPKDKTEAKLRTELVVHVRPYGGFGMALSANRANVGESVSLYLHNQGSDDLTMALSARSVDNALNIKFGMSRVTLAAGARSQVKVELQARSRPWVGKPEVHKFVVMAQAQNAAHFIASLEGKATLEPRLPMWGAITGAGIIGGLLLAVIAVLLGVFRPASNPNISHLSINSERLALGDPIELKWQASDVTSFKLNVDGLLKAELDGSVRQYTLETDNLVGAHTILLQAQNGDKVAEKSVETFVYQPMTIASFNVSPNTLVRNVVSALTIEWSVVGAVDIELRGLENFTNAPLPTTLKATGSLQGIGGTPSDPLTLTLFVTDEVGNTDEQTITLAVTDPTCTAKQDVALYEGPDTRYQQVSRVPANTNVVVSAQDASSGWLRVVLAGDVNAWGAQDSFTCASNFVLKDLRTEVNIPALPTTTPVLLPSLTPQPTVSGTKAP